MAGNNGGPWGGSGNNGSGGDDDRRDGGLNGGNNGGQRPGGNRPAGSEIDDLVNKGREQLRVLMGGGNGRRPANGEGGGPSAPQITRGMVGLAALGVVALWLFASFYTVKPEEKSVELMLGKFYSVGEPGLNFAPWPIVTREVLAVTSERIIDIGTSTVGDNAGLMLTGDENIVDIDFQVVWNITDPQKYLFNLANPPQTIDAVAESAMREIIAQSELAPILNRDRGAIADRLRELIQLTLDQYDSGVAIIRVNFDKADPPVPVIASFRKVQDAEQERDRLQNVADGYAAQVVAEARGNAARILEEAEGYRARVVNEAEGEASRFSAVLTEYQAAPEVTRKRLFLETMERVMGRTDIIIMDDATGGGQGVVPYLPLGELRSNTRAPATDTNINGGSN